MVYSCRTHAAKFRMAEGSNNTTDFSKCNAIEISFKTKKAGDMFFM